MKIGNKIPPEIAAKLKESVRRVRLILLLRGLAVVVTVALASLLVSMAIDAMVTIFSGWIRWGLWAAAVAATGVAAWFALVKPLCRRFTPAEIAALIERNHPELEERLSTVVELAAEDGTYSSSALLDALRTDAVRDAGKVSPRREFTSRTLKPRVIAAGAFAAVLAILFFAFPSATRRLATRALVPVAEVDNIYASSLTVTPGDAVLLAGSPFTVSLAVEGGFPSKAYMRTRYEGEGETVERMLKTSPDGVERSLYEFAYPSVSRSFVYRVNCGNALTRGYQVTVVPEPAYSDRVIELAHPAYTGRPADVYTNTADIVGLAGSSVRVTVKPSRADLKGVAVLPNGARADGEWEDGRMVFSFGLSEGGDGPWGIALSDGYGFSNRFETATVSVVKDTPPEITITDPTAAELRLPLTGELPLVYEIKEDFGVAEVQLEMKAGNGPWTDVETLETERTDSVIWRGQKIFRFAGRKLDNAGWVVFRIKAADSCPASAGGPGVARSREIKVTLVQSNTSLDRESIKEQIRAVEKAQQNIVRNLQDAQRQADQARHSLKSAAESKSNAWQEESANKALNYARSKVLNAREEMKNLVEALKESKLADAEKVFQPVLEQQEKALAKIEDTFLPEKTAERVPLAAEAAKEVAESLEEMQQAVKEFAHLADAAERVQKLEDYAAREEALAKMAKEGDITYDELAKQEQRQLDRFNEDFRKELNGNLDSQQREAERLQKRCEELSARQAEHARKADELSAQKLDALKRSGELEQAQKDARKELEQLAKTVQEAQKKADHLAAKAEEAQKKGEELPKHKQEELAKAKEDAAHHAGEHAKASEHAEQLAKELAKAKEEAGDIEAEKKAFADKQRRIADELNRLAIEAQSLADNVERETGTEKLDANKTLEPFQEAQHAAKDAMEHAKDAAKQLDEALDLQQTKAELKSAQEKLAALGEQLAKAQEKMTAKEAQMKAESETYQEMRKAIEQAVTDAKTAAQEEKQLAEQQAQQAQQAQQQSQQNQQAQQQANQQSQQNQQAQQNAQQQSQQQAQQSQQQAQQSQQSQQQAQQAQPQAQQSAKSAANELRQKAQEEAEKHDLDLGKFEEPTEGEESEEGEESDEESDEEQPQSTKGKSRKHTKLKPSDKNDTAAYKLNGEKPDGSGVMDWFKLKSKSGAGAETDALEDVPEEYRGLVRDYFRALNEGGKK